MKNRIQKHPYLKKYAKHYIKTEGDREDGSYLPYLVIWFREMFKACKIDDSEVPEILAWDDNMTDEFFSWGHNSRWNHVFDSWLEGDVEGIEMGRMVVKTLGEDASYSLATGILYRLYSKGYCAWQTYTREDIRENMCLKRLPKGKLDDIQIALSEFFTSYYTGV